MHVDQKDRLYLSQCECGRKQCQGWRLPSGVIGRWVHPNPKDYQFDPLGRPWTRRNSWMWSLEVDK